MSSTSDVRTKENVIPIQNPLTIINQLNGVYFNFISVDPSKQRVGLIAQDVQSNLPQVVFEDQEGYLSVSYGNIVALLIEGIKDLHAQVATLQGMSKTP